MKQAAQAEKIVKLWKVEYMLAQVTHYAEKVRQGADAHPESPFLQGANKGIDRMIGLMVKLIKDWKPVE